jgi:hypothetical protein
MKIKISTKFIGWILGILIIPIVFTSCSHHDDDDTTTPTTTGGGSNTPKGQLYFHLHTYIDNNEVDLYNTNYTADDGRKISLQLAQLYLSDIQLVKLDGSTVSVPGRHILMEQDIATYLIADVSVGNYKSVRFKIGLDPATNGLNPSEMWFGSTPQPDGYAFVSVKGKIDTSENADNSAMQMQFFEYKIGTNDHYIQVNMPDRNFSVFQNQIQYVHVLVDYYKLFNGLKLNEPSNLSATSAAVNNQSPATNIANNIPSMFRYEE